MHYAFLVDVCNRLDNAAHYSGGFLISELLPALLPLLDQLSKLAAPHQLHGEKYAAADLPDVLELHDILVMHALKDLCLLLEKFDVFLSQILPFDDLRGEFNK
jgi:hypothetical protein